MQDKNKTLRNQISEKKNEKDSELTKEKKDRSVLKKNKNSEELVIKDLKQKLKDAEDKLLRSLAENDNLRKRHDKEIEDNLKYATKTLSYSMLTVADNLNRAIESIPKEEIDKAPILKDLIIGIQAVEKEFIDVLDKNGVTKFDSLHEKFNPELHQAVSKVHDDEKPEGIIISEMQKGFKIGDRLLRPSMVVVSMGPEKK